MAPPVKWGDALCGHCGKTFRKRTAKSFLCSPECRDAKRRIERPELICETCGETFTVRSVYYADGDRARRFCSAICRQIGHRVLPTPENIEAKFWASVDKRGPDDCWHWKLVPGNNGYGLVTFWQFKQTAHRVSYELHNGPIPEGEGAHGTCVLHKCDNRICVNPAHLFLGSQADNMHDMIAKGRQNFTAGRSQRAARMSPRQ